MRRAIIYSVIIAAGFVFTQCSWIEQFIIYNKSDKAIYINYEIEDGDAFPIFYDHPSLHQVTRSGSIDWASEMHVNDENALNTKVSIALPPNCVLIFGGLHNDQYRSYDQKFINDRKFNLKHLQVLAYGKSLDIVPSTFDTYFKKHQGQIRLTIK